MKRAVSRAPFRLVRFNRGDAFWGFGVAEQPRRLRRAVGTRQFFELGKQGLLRACPDARLQEEGGENLPV